MRLLFPLFIFAALIGRAQPYPQPNAAEMLMALEKLQTLGTVLYIAAHPDDENTRLITWLSKHRHYRVGYLSLTRGDGGQNLIGTERGDQLGILRTQELLEARRIDGAEQFFTRAIDFGYSKTAEESMEIWGKSDVLADMVWVIRSFRPDILITRFTSRGGGHGHHTASAILAEEALAAAGDPTMFPEQLEHVETWQPKRLLFNTYSWGRDDVDHSQHLGVDVGSFNPTLNKAYTEIAAESRSQHKSQGFGALRQRGTQMEWLEHTRGIKAEKDLMEGIATSWNRILGAQEVEAALHDARRAFDPQTPDAMLPHLLRAYQAMKPLLKKDPIVEVKLAELTDLIIAAAGLWVELSAPEYSGYPGEMVTLTAEVIARTATPIKLKEFYFNREGGYKPETEVILKRNEPALHSYEFQIPEHRQISQPHWLMEEAQSAGMYTIEKQQDRGSATKNDVLYAVLPFDIGGTQVDITRPVMYKWRDPVAGERYRPYAVVPQATVTPDREVYLFTSAEARKVSLTVRGNKAGFSGVVSLGLGEGWRSVPESQPITLKQKGDEQVVHFEVYPPARQTAVIMKPSISGDGSKLDRAYREISYDHITMQANFPLASSKLIHANLNCKGKTVGYVMGAGDLVAEAIGQMGYEVTMITKDNFDQIDLATLDIVVIGIRAYNTEDWLHAKHASLMKYVENGGHMIVQYQTSRGLETSTMAPYALTLGRARVTEEDSRVEFLDRQHALLKTPHKITEDDFLGWVQERGLYFASEWTDEYDAVIGWNDEGETLQEGALLAARHGKGTYIFTGISFFRQLPAGVPGAYRLFANILSYGQ